MSNILKIDNNLTIGAPKTFISYSEVSGTGVIRWKNPSGFSASWGIQLGETGEEQAEVVILGASTPSGTAGTLTANTLYEHAADTPIYGINYDKLVIKVSTGGTSGTATAITDGTITIDPSGTVTQYTHTAGIAGYAYKTAFYNSVTTELSTDSDWITTSGYDYYSLYSIRERIKSKLWNASYITDSIINLWINEWLEKMTSAGISVNQDYALGSTSVSFGTAGLGTITASDFRGQTRRVWVTYDGGQNNYQCTKTTIREFIPDQQFSTTHPYFYMYSENVIGIKPEESGGTAQVIYPTLFTPLVNDTDSLPVSIRPFSKSFVDYGLAMALYKDQKSDVAKSKEGDANVELERFKLEISPRNKTGPTYIQLVEPITGVSDGLVI
jgi:hypothetical protein